MKRWFILAAPFFALMALEAMADKGWTAVETLKAGGEAQTVAVNRPISKVAITCGDGNVTIQSVTVVEGGKRTSFHVASKLKKGETQQISVGDNVSCDRLVLLVEGQGTYHVRVR